VRKLVVLLALPLALAFCGGDEESERPYRPPGIANASRPDDGREFYLRDCAWCHGDQGSGTERGPELITGTNGPALNHFMLTTGRMPIGYPSQRVRRHDPSYTDEQIDEIVDFMRTFDADGPEIPSIELEGDLTHGLALYQENCAACHSTTGIGGALTPSVRGDSGEGLTASSSLVAPGLEDSTPVEVAEAIRTGPGTMPVFAEQTIPEADVSAIVRYVEYLQDPADPGGAPVGRVGPVVEGAIGWILGLGLLVLFVRWVGTKRGEL
jgi:ubiquinol-cytochrome c reductase cytochrome c subunit